MSELKSSNKKWGRQMVGIFGGAAIGWSLTLFFPVLEERFGMLTIMLWSGAIGGILTSLGQFMRAGAALTRKDNHILNLIVGLVIPVLLLLILYLISR